MACVFKTADQLLPELRTLEREVQAAVEEAVSFRKLNARFDKTNETTQILLTACEQLWTEKMSIDHANFQEHTSELSYLTQHYNTGIYNGLAEHVYNEKAATLLTRKRGNEGRERRFFSFCCSSDFPPQQSWWFDVQTSLVPRVQVVRGGNLLSCAATDLVPGDVAYFHAGQRAVADGRVLVFSEGTAVDVSHLTTRASDVRLCSAKTTASTIHESRNIILKDCHIINGSLFCMIVRSPYECFIPASTYDGQEGFEPTIDTAVPVGLTLGTCQSLVRTLCVRARLFCKSFRSIERFASAQYVIVTLTQELLSKGTVPKFCAAVRKMKRSLVLVNCDCPRDSLGQLCQELGVTCVDFEDTEDAFAAGKGARSDRTSAASATSIDLTVCAGPVGMEQVGDYEQSKLKPLVERLRGPEPVVAVVSSISQAALLNLCTQLKSGQKPLLYAMASFHYSKCYRNLISAGNAKHGNKRAVNSAIGYSEESTCAGSLGRPSPPLSRMGDYDGDMTPSADNTIHEMKLHPVSKAASMAGKESDVAFGSEPRPRGSLESTPITDAGSMSLRSDPAPHLQIQKLASNGPAINPALKTQSMVPQLGTGADEVFVSVNSIGIVSDSADCVLFKSDLGCLGDALDRKSVV